MSDQKSKRCCSSFWGYMPTERKLGGAGILTCGMAMAVFYISQGYIHQEIPVLLITVGIFALAATDEEEHAAQVASRKMKKD